MINSELTFRIEILNLGGKPLINKLVLDELKSIAIMARCFLRNTFKVVVILFCVMGSVSVLVASSSKSDKGKADTSKGGRNELILPKINRGRLWLELGNYYASHEKLGDAKAAYLKAVESDSFSIIMEARDSLYRILDKKTKSESGLLNGFAKDSFLNGIKSAIAAVGLALGTALILSVLFLLVRPPSKWIGEKRGNNKIQVTEMIEDRGSGLGAAFGDVVSTTLEEIHFASRGEGTISSLALAGPLPSKLPHYLNPHGREIVEISEAALGGSWGKIVEMFLKTANRPEYSISGRLLVVNERVKFFVKLSKRGKRLKLWDLTFPVDRALEVEKDLAWAVIAQILEDKEDGNVG